MIHYYLVLMLCILEFMHVYWFVIMIGMTVYTLKKVIEKRSFNFDEFENNFDFKA